MNKAAASKATGTRGGGRQAVKTGKAAKKAPLYTSVRPGEKNLVRNEGDTQRRSAARKPKPSDFLKPNLVRDNERIFSGTQYKWSQLSSALSLKEARFKSSKEKIAATNRKRLKAGKACTGHYRATSGCAECRDIGDQYRPNDKFLHDNFLKQRMENQTAGSSYMSMGTEVSAWHNPDQMRSYRDTPHERSTHDPEQNREQWRRYREDLAHFQALVKHMVKGCMDVGFKFGIQSSLFRNLDLHENASYASIIEFLLNECDFLCAKQEHELLDYNQREKRSRCPLPEARTLQPARHEYPIKQSQHATGASKRNSRCTCYSNTGKLDCGCFAP